MLTVIPPQLLFQNSNNTNNVTTLTQEPLIDFFITIIFLFMLPLLFFLMTKDMY